MRSVARRVFRDVMGKYPKKLKFSAMYSPLGVGGRQTKHTKAQFSQHQSPPPLRAKHLSKGHKYKANPTNPNPHLNNGANKVVCFGFFASSCHKSILVISRKSLPF